MEAPDFNYSVTKNIDGTTYDIKINNFNQYDRVEYSTYAEWFMCFPMTILSADTFNAPNKMIQLFGYVGEDRANSAFIPVPTQISPPITITQFTEVPYHTISVFERDKHYIEISTNDEQEDAWGYKINCTNNISVTAAGNQGSQRECPYFYTAGTSRQANSQPGFLDVNMSVSGTDIRDYTFFFKNSDSYVGTFVGNRIRALDSLNNQLGYGSVSSTSLTTHATGGTDKITTNIPYSASMSNTVSFQLGKANLVPLGIDPSIENPYYEVTFTINTATGQKVQSISLYPDKDGKIRYDVSYLLSSFLKPNDYMTESDNPYNDITLYATYSLQARLNGDGLIGDLFYPLGDNLFTAVYGTESLNDVIVSNSDNMPIQASYATSFNTPKWIYGSLFDFGFIAFKLDNEREYRTVYTQLDANMNEIPGGSSFIVNDISDGVNRFKMPLMLNIDDRCKYIEVSFEEDSISLTNPLNIELIRGGCDIDKVVQLRCINRYGLYEYFYFYNSVFNNESKSSSKLYYRSGNLINFKDVSQSVNVSDDIVSADDINAYIDLYNSNIVQIFNDRTDDWDNCIIDDNILSHNEFNNTFSTRMKIILKKPNYQRW